MGIRAESRGAAGAGGGAGKWDSGLQRLVLPRASHLEGVSSTDLASLP